MIAQIIRRQQSDTFNAPLNQMLNTYYYFQFTFRPVAHRIVHQRQTMTYIARELVASLVYNNIVMIRRHKRCIYFCH